MYLLFDYKNAIIVGNGTELIKLRDKVKTEEKFELLARKKKIEMKSNYMIPLEKIAAIAAGLVYSDNMTEFRIRGK